jgi:amino acid adenylation domain-containing protein
MNDLMCQIADLSQDRRELLCRQLRGRGATLRSTIPPRPKAEEVPLSFVQEQLWFLEQLQPGNPAYHIAVAVRFRGALDPVSLEQALRAIVTRHETLRTTLVSCDGKPVQVIAPIVILDVPLVDLRELPVDEREDKARELAVEESRKPFALARGPLLRVRLLRLGHEEHVLVLVVHHIAADGWSMRLLLGELAQFYEAFAAGQRASLPGLAIQYADYAAWLRGSQQGELFQRQLAYWKDQLAGAPPTLELPTDRPRPAAQTSRGARHCFHLPAALDARLRELGRRTGSTPFMVLLATFQAVLSRYGGQEDLCIGTPIAGRTRPELERLIGFFVNMLVLRTDLSGDPTLEELLVRVRQACLGAYAHADLPFETLVEALQPERDLSRTPLFQAMFSLDLEPEPCLELPGLTVTSSELDHGTAKFDLSLYVRQRGGALAGYLEYNTDLFQAETAGRLLGHWQTLLAGALADPTRRLSKLPLLVEDERRRILVEWNDTAAPVPTVGSLHQVVEVQVDRTPEAVALVCGEDRLTYRELNRRANQLAHYLRTCGVGPEELVGVYLDRSKEMVVALLAALKAGGAYVPLDPTYPAERLAFVLEDARVRVIVTRCHLRDRLPPSAAQLVCVDAESAAIARAGDSNPVGGAAPDNLAYVLYTSGSTGRPKGVAVEHHSLAGFIAWIRRLLSAGELAGVLAGTSISFDISALELFAPLSSGGQVILAEDPLELSRLPAASAVTLISTVPSAMAALLEMRALPPSVQTVILGGETLPQPLARRVYETGTVRRLYNLYGPTETTVYSTCALVPPDVAEAPSIGRPIANTQVYVLDGHRQPVPIGVPGELYIGGAGLARGYLRQEELTAQKFVPDPFCREPGARLYRTGDRVRWRPSGELDFLGRTDHQLKIRGFRIEPAEVEAALRRHPAVRQAVVVARDSAGDKCLVAYVAADRHSPPSPQELHRCLREHLPEYMVPSAFVLLDDLPLTPNGKIDRKALPEPEPETAASAEVEGPRTPVEEIVAEVWADALRVPRVGLHANFFYLGGHSLLATRVVSRLRDTLRVDLPVRALFEAPTVADLAAYIEAAQNARPALTTAPIQPVAREGRLPLSFA